MSYIVFLFPFPCLVDTCTTEEGGTLQNLLKSLVGFIYPLITSRKMSVVLLTVIWSLLQGLPQNPIKGISTLVSIVKFMWHCSLH